jgi:hypothetical protein
MQAGYARQIVPRRTMVAEWESVWQGLLYLPCCLGFGFAYYLWFLCLVAANGNFGLQAGMGRVD